MKRAWRILTACAVVIVACRLHSRWRAGRLTCDSYRVLPGMSLSWNGGVLSAASPGSRAVASCGEESKYEADLMLFHAIPVKPVSVSVVEQKQVIPCGTPFGIKMFTDGVMVVGTAENPDRKRSAKPCRRSRYPNGRHCGNRERPGCESQRRDRCNRGAERGKARFAELPAGRKVLQCSLLPAKSQADGLWKAGIWVRDSTAGIGTLTFYDPESQPSADWATASATQTQAS